MKFILERTQSNTRWIVVYIYTYIMQKVVRNGSAVVSIIVNNNLNTCIKPLCMIATLTVDVVDVYLFTEVTIGNIQQ